jgi:hypothetical protein
MWFRFQGGVAKTLSVPLANHTTLFGGVVRSDGYHINVADSTRRGIGAMSRKRRENSSIIGPPDPWESVLIKSVLVYALVLLFAALVFVWYLVTAFKSPKASFNGAS